MEEYLKDNHDFGYAVSIFLLIIAIIVIVWRVSTRKKLSSEEWIDQLVKNSTDENIIKIVDILRSDPRNIPSDEIEDILKKYLQGKEYEERLVKKLNYKLLPYQYIGKTFAHIMEVTDSIQLIENEPDMILQEEFVIVPEFKDQETDEFIKSLEDSFIEGHINKMLLLLDLHRDQERKVYYHVMDRFTDSDKYNSLVILNVYAELYENELTSY